MTRYRNEPFTEVWGFNRAGGLMQRADNMVGKFCLGQQRVTPYLRGWRNGY